MTSAKKRIAYAVMSAAVVGAAAFSGQPAAVAYPDETAKEVTMPFPLAGEHRVVFSASSVCSWPSGKGNEAVRQTLMATAYDRDAPSDGNFLDPMHYLPFNSITVDWANKTSDASGQAKATSNGSSVHADRIETGTGDLDVTVTVTRSMLPIVFDDFPLSSALSVTHSESFLVKAIDPVACEASPG